MTMTRIWDLGSTAPVLALVLVFAACGRSPVAYGTAASVIVTADPGLWESVEERVYDTLEPRIFTVRDERTFELTYAEPASEEWTQLRQWRQVLIMGEAWSPWVAPALARHEGPVPDPPALIEVRDVWARGQVVTLMVLPEGGDAGDVAELLPSLHELLDARFREYTLRRMYVSGRDTALARELLDRVGFALTLPQVYRWTSSDSVYVFRNDHPTPGRLERSILVTWRNDGTAAVSSQEILAWRDRVGALYYDPPQVTEMERVQARRLGEAGVEIQGIWSTPPDEWPAAGPFMTRAVACPDQGRTYLVDAWLFAPREQKYEYMLQLETILDTFRCSEEPALAGG